ncbi:MAG: CSLREA domain-containing protein [Planctomycetaceae bacterium]
MISGKKLQSVFKALTSHLQHSRGQSSRRKGNRRLSFTEPLEVRALLTTFIVTNLNDAGSGSLREAINQANSASGVDAITFSNGLNGTISLTSGTLFIRDSVNIFGPGASQLAISGGSSNFEVIQADDLAPSLKDVQISGLTIRDGGNGTTFMNGAGIFSRENLTLTNVALLNNNAGASLGLAGGGGGALQMFAGNLKMQNCTVAGNRAKQGGGIELSSDAVSGEIVNSTISGNQAEGFGGGVLATNGAVVIRNSTITGNRANSNDLDGNTAGGGVFGNLSGTIPLLTLHNTIVAGNLWGPSNSEPDDIGNPVTSDSSNNVIGNAMFSGGLVNGTNFNLVGNNGTGTRPIASILNTTLANNGGPTQTHALVANSVAINAGNNSQVIGIDGNALTTDQRGSFRIFENVDIGAVELIAVTNPIVVDTSVDENDGNVSPGGVSLREAILLANTVAGANTITFANATNGQPIDLSSLGRFEISETLTINGNGAANTIIDGGQSTNGIFLVQSSAGNVTFSGLTLRNGLASDSGGAISFLSNGVLTINQSTLSGNSNSSGSGGSRQGGAIFAVGAVTINQSTLSGNSRSRNSVSQGGAIFAYGAVTINQSTLSGHSSSSGDSSNIACSQGGAIFAVGAVTIRGNCPETAAAATAAAQLRRAIGRWVTINQSTLRKRQQQHIR